MYDAVIISFHCFFQTLGSCMSEKTLIIILLVFFKYVEFQYRVLKLLTEIKETLKANPNAAFRTDCTSPICFEKFDDIKKFLESMMT